MVESEDGNWVTWEDYCDLGWIPVDERLPEVKNGEIRARYFISEAGNVLPGYYYPKDSRWTDSGINEITTVTHWMEFPKAP